VTHDLEARLRATYGPLAADSTLTDDLARALDDATQAPPPRTASRILPWAVACAATLVGALLLLRRPGPSGTIERPAHDGPAATAFVDARGRTTLAGVDGRALRTWELGVLPVGYAIPAEMGEVLAAEVAPFGPPTDAARLPALPDVPFLGRLFRGASPVALIVDAAADAPWRHVETVLLAAVHARMAEIVFLDPTRAGPPITERLPFDAPLGVGEDVVRSYERLEFPALHVQLRPDASGAPTVAIVRPTGRAEFSVRDPLALTELGFEIAASVPADGGLVVEIEVAPRGADRADLVTFAEVLAVQRAVHAAGVERVHFRAGAGRSGAK